MLKRLRLLGQRVKLKCDEIGFEHGAAAHTQVSRTIDFYAGVFRDMSKMSWAKVQELAMTFEPVIRKKWPAYFEEMRGLLITDPCRIRRLTR